MFLSNKKELVQLEEVKENLKNYYFIIVMDLCSSSVILEKLQNSGNIKIWRKFWKSIFNTLTRTPYFSIRCKPYKFVGDGFIILYRHQFADSLYDFMESCNKIFCNTLEKILKEYNIEPKRFGFAYGIDRGRLIHMNLLGKHEYMGEAINAAVRLQGQLKANEDANSIMISDNVFKMIKIPENVRQVEKKCVLRNLYDDKELNCRQIWL